MLWNDLVTSQVTLSNREHSLEMTPKSMETIQSKLIIHQESDPVFTRMFSKSWLPVPGVEPGFGKSRLYDIVIALRKVNNDQLDRP
jgi:hypothetical protein